MGVTSDSDPLRLAARGSQVSESVFWCMNHNITPLYRLMAAMEEDKGEDEEQERRQTGPP